MSRLPASCLITLGLLTPGLLGSAALAQAPTPAADATPLTLQSAVSDALQHRPLVLESQERVGAARGRVQQARAGLLPRLDLQASATDGPLGSPPLGLGGLVGTPLKKHTGGSLNLVQTLLDFGRTHNTVRARRSEVAATEAALGADRNRVVLEVQRAYLQALQAQRLVRVNELLVTQRQLVARQATVQMQNGLGTRVDVDLAEVGVSEAQLALVRARNDVKTAFNALGTAVGRDVSPSTVLADVLTDAGPAGTESTPAPVERPVPPSTDEAAVAEALRSRPELRQAEAQIQASDHLTSAARAERRPLLNGVASVGKVNPSPLLESSDKPFAVGVALTVPLFTGGLVEGRVEEARRNANAARQNLEELRNGIRQQAADAVANLSAAEEAVQVSRARLTQATDAQSLATQRYEARLGTIVELTQAQTVYATAQYDLVRSLYERELAHTALDYALGRPYVPSADEGK